MERLTQPPARGSRQAWQRWLLADEPTGSVPIAQRLKGTPPFRDPRRMDAPEEDRQGRPS